jgi:hypothetical protein
MAILLLTHLVLGAFAVFAAFMLAVALGLLASNKVFISSWLGKPASHRRLFADPGDRRKATFRGLSFTAEGSRFLLRRPSTSWPALPPL